MSLCKVSRCAYIYATMLGDIPCILREGHKGKHKFHVEVRRYD